MNVAVVGHVDHGKSTLIGRILYDSESLPEDRLAEIQKLLEEYKKRFEFAYFLDSFEEELKEERTIDTTRVFFKGKERLYTIVDVPGHREFIKNMLTGASRADIAILVVAVDEGVREQTKRHSFLLSLLGINKVIVLINKMDLVQYRGEEFERVKGEVSELLSSFKISPLNFIPISALEGDNVYKRSRWMDWYKGPTFIEALDAVEEVRRTERPLRFVVQGIYEGIVVGRVESGVLRRGDELLFLPSGFKGRVEGIKRYPEDIEEAFEGDSIGIITGSRPERGDVGGRLSAPPVSSRGFLGEVVILEGGVEKGEEVLIKCGTRRVRGLVKEIRERIDSETGEILEKNPAKIPEGDAGVFVFDTEPIVLEKFSEIPELGRFVLIRNGRNIGAGIVLANIPETNKGSG